MPAKAKVSSWLNSATPDDSDIDDDDDVEEPTENLGNGGDEDNDSEVGPSGQKDWEQVLRSARQRLVEGKVGRRVRFMQDELKISATSPPDSHTNELVSILLGVLPRYQDQASRDALFDILLALVKRDEAKSAEGSPNASGGNSLAEKLIRWLGSEIVKVSDPAKTVATSTISPLFTLSVSLATSLFAARGTSFTSAQPFKNLLVTIAVGLDGILSEKVGERAKEGIRRAALVKIRRLIRQNYLQTAEFLEILLDESKTQGSRVLTLIGVVVAVCLRLKPTNRKGTTASTPLEFGRAIIQSKKAVILQLYIEKVLSSKVEPPRHVITACDDFLSAFLTLKDLDETVIPSAVKMLIRSPEAALPVVAHVLEIISLDLSELVPKALFPSILSASKSSNESTRAKSISLFKSVLKAAPGDVAQQQLAGDLLTLLATGKATGVENKIALLRMVELVPCSLDLSDNIVRTLSGLTTKEGNETALSAICDALGVHLSFCLSENPTPLPATVMASLAKDMASSKTSTKRLVAHCVGQSLWASGQNAASWSKSGEALALAVAPTLESYIKSASTVTVTSGTAFLMEGYLAAAIALGPMAQSPVVSLNTLSNKNPLLAAIGSATGKPSFLLSERLQKKIILAEDEPPQTALRTRTWLLRAIDALIGKEGSKMTHNQKSMCGYPILHVFLEAPDKESRRAAEAIVQQRAERQRRVIGDIVLDSVTAMLGASAVAATSSSAISLEFSDNESGLGKSLVTLLSLLVTSTDKAKETDTESLLVESIVVAHHPALGALANHAWIDLIIAANRDPGALCTKVLKRLVDRIMAAVSIPLQSTSLALAAYKAASTLIFISPEGFLPVFLEQLVDDLSCKDFAAIGTLERGIWETPEGKPFVDVLALKKPAAEINKNSKAYKEEQWDREMRETLAKKKEASASGTLSKQDKALVDGQLKIESDVRKKLQTLQAKYLRGLSFVVSLVEARTDSVRLRISELAGLVMEGPLRAGAFLTSREAFEVYLALSDLCPDRLGVVRRFIGIAILRAFDIPDIPEDYLHEPLSDLVIRVLHRLRSVSDQTPLDTTSFSYIAPLLSQVISASGLGKKAGSEEALEQLTLVVEIISLNALQFGLPGFPRQQIIQDLLQLASSQPRLAKPSVAALIDIGAAMKDIASPGDLQALLEGALSPDSFVRNGSLQSLQPVDLTDLDYSGQIYLARFDEDAQNARLAEHLWEDNGLDVPADFLPKLLPFLSHDIPYVRSSGARALADATENHLEQLGQVLAALQELYVEMARVRAPEFDQYGMVIPESLDNTDPYTARVAIAKTLLYLAPFLQSRELSQVFDFLVLQEALGDQSSSVRQALLETGSALVDMHGYGSLPNLIRLFEDYLSSSASAGVSGDHVKESVIILFGRLAKHLTAGDDRLPRVIDRLIVALDTPSEIVQAAVADCLPPLIKMLPDSTEELLDRLYNSLTTGSKYAIRRGAAFGLAGVVKGRGISALSEYDIITKLTNAVEEKKIYQARQGAVFAFETLSAMLGRAFEPYIITIISLLLDLFGDSNVDVREATTEAAKVIMSKISGFCVKQILPVLLEGLDEKQWRTKKGSIELLGTMAFCAPKQLSMSLPTIIPKLTSVLTDSHAQVRSAANSSLKRFGEVLSNPEIKSMQPVLLKALVDPTSKTNSALAALLGTSFEHYLDSPSLALIMPILVRGLKDRSSESKRKSVQIVGNMASLTESRDLIPYLNQLMPLVQIVLVDPVPEARATAAKALGTLVERLGEDNFPALVTNLLQTLRSDTSGVDRQGAAQGLSEVLSGLGMERMEGLLPDIINNAASPRPYIREGFISLLVYLPTTFGHRFAPHLGRIIPPILGGLADESEYVRDASMRAGKMIIINYSAKAIDLLLPELERGMLDSAWRIRQSSISLTGELLYRVAGISGKVEIEEEDGPAQHSDAARKALTEALGQEGRDRVLATLYIVRQDAVGIVRQSSIHIWKALVSNTPRTTREILPMLVSMILKLLSSEGQDQRETASRTLGELCKKNGDRILAEVVPILRAGVMSQDASTREGACLALTEIMEASSEEHIAIHENTIIDAVRIALVDEVADVRSAAARTFDSMQQHIGPKAIDKTIPTLLEAMRTPGPGSETALMALKEVMSVRATSVFPTLLPTLTAQPITAFNARALAALVTVAGNALSKRLGPLLGALVKASETEKDDVIKGEVDGAIRALLASVEDIEGLHSLQMLLLGWSKEHDVNRRATACDLFAIFCEVTELDASNYRVDWIRQLISLMDDRTEAVVASAWGALDALVKSIGKDELEDLVVPLRRSIESTGSPGRTVPGFSRPKGLQPIIPILLAGVLGGTQEQREQAAFGIGDIVQRTSEAAIKPYVIQLTGPLIRVISSQAIAAQIKGAILSALTILLEEVPQLVRPFHPQLTRTFVKSVSDPASLAVRNRAVVGLGELMKHQPRVDPLVTELITGISTSESDIAPSVIEALAAVCKNGGKNMGAGVKQSAIELCEQAFETKNTEPYNAAIGKVLAGLSLHDSEVVSSILREQISASMPPAPIKSICILMILENNPGIFKLLDMEEEVASAIQAAISLDQPSVSRPAREAKTLFAEIKESS